MAEQISILGDIGIQTTATEVNSQILALSNSDDPDKDIDLFVDSPGGSVFDGFSIAGVLKKFKRDNPTATITANIFGMAASIATFIALQADKIIIDENAKFLIHNPSGAMQGNKEDFEKAAKELENIEEDLINLYVARSHLSRKKVEALMDDDKFITAKEAKEFGFVDEIVGVEALKAVARIDISKVNNNKMPDEKTLNLLQKMAKGIENLTNSQKRISNVTLTLSTGQKIFVNSENVQDIEGKDVKLIDADGAQTSESPENGLHDLADGRAINVADGTITEVKEIGQMEELKNQLSEVVTNLTTLTEAFVTMQKDNEKIKADSTVLIEELTNKVDLQITDIKNNMVTSPAHSTVASLATTTSKVEMDKRPGFKWNR